MSTKYPLLANKEWLENKISTTPLRKIAEEIGSSYSAVVFMTRKHKIRVPVRRKHIFKDWSNQCKKAFWNKWPNGRQGPMAANWRGGTRRAGEYKMVYSPNHPNHTKEKYVMEHILVAEKKIGRYLKPGEIVHHINHDKKDNRPENLEVMTKSEHVALHFSEGREVAHLKAKLKRYEAKFGPLD